MTGITGILEVVYPVLLVLLWAGVLFTAVRTGLRLGSARASDESIPMLLWRHRGRLLFLAVIVVAAMVVTTRETAYRPKVTVNPANPALQERLKRVDEATPEVAPADARPSWDEVQQKNREENERAREEFNKLPSNKK